MSRVVSPSLLKRACAPTLPEFAILALAMLSAGCADSTAPAARRPAALEAQHSLSGGTANVALSTSNAAISQTSNTAWTLAKTGAVNTSSKTVTWTITATKQPTKAGELVVTGFVAVTNSGSANATIGNIVANLQTKSGSSWQSVSADCADATHDDAATSCKIDPKASSENLAVFAENAASGSLKFMDANANTVFSLVPQQGIAPGATVTLLFAATFDNTVLHLSAGQAVRAEVIVSFGHSTANKPSAENVDINGNGVIDADEAWVRSIPTRLGLTVPAQQADNSTLTIHDAASNITTTGDVTFSNAQFSLGATSGTVTVSYNGGANGGKITNCATGTGAGTTVNIGGFVFPVDGSVGLQSCNTQDIGATPPCTSGALGCGWQTGDLTTYTQGDWGGDVPSSAAKALLESDFTTVYTATFFKLIVGGTFTMTFDSAVAIEDYLAQSGTAAPLDANLGDPTTSASGKFGGDVVALKLNVDFSDAGFTASSAGLKFGDLTMCNTGLASLNGITVRQFLDATNTLLGGGTSSYGSIADLQPIAVDLNAAFADGAPSTFAQTSLVNGPSCGWKNGDLNTFDQSAWGVPSTGAGTTLNANYSSVYASTFGIVEVGIPGATGFSMQFDTAIGVFDYLPTLGAPAALDADLFDTLISSSGQFGGDVLALRLNVDFSDANVLPSTVNVKFGDLTMCGFTTLTALNGTTVRSFLGTVNTLLGGGSGTYSIAQLDPITIDLNNAFSAGMVSSFAQAHLVNGTCP
jgi:hypothetical protein